jgi:hypothetical protein
VPAFDDSSAPPSETALADLLGAAVTPWADTVAACPAGTSFDWKFYGRKAGWVLRARQKKRTLLYLVPDAGRCDAVFVFGNRAAELASRSPLPDEVLLAISTATPHVEGRSFRVPVASAIDVATVAALLDIKLSS